MRTECPHCNTRYDIEDQYKGQILACPNCNKEFQINDIPKKKTAVQAAPPAENKEEPKYFAKTEFCIEIFAFLLLIAVSLGVIGAVVAEHERIVCIVVCLSSLLSSILLFALQAILFFLRKIEENTRPR